MGREENAGRQGIREGIKIKWERQDLKEIERKMNNDTGCFCFPSSLFRDEYCSDLSRTDDLHCGAIRQLLFYVKEGMKPESNI